MESQDDGCAMPREKIHHHPRLHHFLASSNSKGQIQAILIDLDAHAI